MPINTLWHGRIQQATDVARNIFRDGATAGRSKVSAGDLILNNADGALDAMLQLAFDGRSLALSRKFERRRVLWLATMQAYAVHGVTILGTDYPAGLVTLYFSSDGVTTGPAESTPSGYTDYFVGTMLSVECTLDAFTIHARDRQVELDKPLLTARYGGGNALPNGLDGTTEIRGKLKPYVAGVVWNIPLVCVNTTKQIYAAHDAATWGALTTWAATYDKAFALTAGTPYTTQADLLDDGLAPAAGYYKAYLAGGFVRLGSSPEGEVTADVTRNVSATVARETAPAEFYKRYLLDAGIASGDILAADITALNTITGAVCGRFVDDDVTVATLCDEVAESNGCWWGVNAAGKFRIVQLATPTGTPVHTFTANQIARDSFTRLPATEGDTPAYATALRSVRNYTVQTDVALTVSDARRALVAQEWQTERAVVGGVQTAHPLAVILTGDTIFAEFAYSIVEALRRIAFRSIQRHRFELTVALDAETAAIDLGDTVGLIYATLDPLGRRRARFGLDIVGDEEGELFTVIGIAPNAKAKRVSFNIWGSAFSRFNRVTVAGDYRVTVDGKYRVTAAA